MSFVGLQTNTPYTLCVIPAGLGIAALGEGVNGAAFSQAHADFSRNCRQFTLSPSPGLIQSLTLTATTHNYAGIGTVPTYTARWSAPTTPAGVQVLGYQVSVSVNGAPAQTSTTTDPVAQGGPMNHGDRACVSVAAIGAPATLGSQLGLTCITLP